MGGGFKLYNKNMTQLITISTITGSTFPCQVYLCDFTLTYCELVSTVYYPSELPLSVNPPTELENVSNIIVKIIDSNNCERISSLLCSI